MHKTDSPPTSKFAIAILAAGKGTRLKSRHPKVLHRVGGKRLLEHVIAAAKSVVAAQDIYTILGYEAEQVRRAVAPSGVNFVLQAEQRGTGHAILCARQALGRYGFFLVLSGDVPLIRPKTIEQVRDFHLAQKAAMTILTANPADPTGYGRIVRKVVQGEPTAEVTRIVEQNSLSPEQAGIHEVNSGIYAFSSQPLFQHIDRLTTDNPHQEFYLTDMAGLLVAAGEKVLALPAAATDEVLGVNTRIELAQLDLQLRRQKVRELMLSGVTIYGPETCVIDSDVTVGPDTVIEPYVKLLGSTQVGSECHIDSFSVIDSSVIADHVTVRPGCIVRESRVETGAMLGPYSHLRPQSEIGPGAHVGNFVETKKTKLGKDAKANHLSYLGDAVIGEGVNIGAGTITCNYDGEKKHPTAIEDGAFIGSDTTLVAPVRVGQGAYVGAASCITEDVPAGALAVARARQTNKEDWARGKHKPVVDKK